ncbi:serine hydrolase domain-containing protein [Polymorphobacter fuscus]|uniref:serine hydrolase domain-containing protein n=1 Tax=Sandarakinorhabdus fusca TaxID=1439888 RepID=UPI0016A2561D|nr:serine hydrolase domain-containing protein [Polymorphobacter fuscus]NJC08863.1 CubicO group peptidase (beta-lactamase class C family) [Polymorphobacter fuscus]
MMTASALTPAAALAAPVAADTAGKTAAGTAFIQPTGFDRVDKGAVTEIQAPEADTRVAIVEVGAAADAAAAAKAAWGQWPGHAMPPVRLETARPAKDGWDARAVFGYDTPPNARRAVQAVALRHGSSWTVLLFDGAEATGEKRGAALGLVSQSLRPAGYTRESFAGRTALPLTPERVEALKAFVRDGMAALDVPGVGLAFIENGKVVWEGGLGVRSLATRQPVDEHTNFMIASNTKSMATMLLAELADAGKLTWDTPVTKVYPAFRLGDDATTAATQIRHLVCACTGLPRKDMEWLFATTAQTPASDTFRQLAATQPTSRFGEAFQYNNLMASAAGYVAANLFYPGMEVGAGFDKAVGEHIWAPVGMTDSTMAFDRALAGNHASPHAVDLDGKAVVSVAGADVNRTIAPFRPAGGAWSSAHDMIRYVGLELAGGKLPDGKQLVSQKNLFERRARGVPTGQDRWYGMGLEEDMAWGVPIIHHGGDLLGFHSDMMWLPQAGVGAVILTNGDDGYALRRPLMRRLVEILYDGKPEAVADVAAAATRTRAEVAEFRGRVTQPADPAATAALAVRYSNPELGPLTVTRRGDKVDFAFTAWHSEMLTHVNTDRTISFLTVTPGLTGLDFVVGGSGGKRTLTMRDAQHEYVFTEAGG